MKKVTVLSLKLILFTVLFAPMTNFRATPTFAYSPVTVNFGRGNNSPLFNLSNMVPGQSENKIITVTNNTTKNLTIGIRGDITSQIGNIADVIHIQIANGTNVVYGANASKTLTDFFNDSSNGQYIQLTNLPKHSSVTYTITATFDQTAGNTYQGKNVMFSLAIGSDIASLHPIPTPKENSTLQKFVTSVINQELNLLRRIFLGNSLPKK